MESNARGFNLFIKRVLIGMLMGAGMIIPGFSGGVIAVIFGLYEQIIAVINHPFRDVRNSVSLALPLVAGAGVSVLALSKVLNWLLERYPLLVIYLFIGLIVGSLPSLVKVATKQGTAPRYYLALIIGLLVMLIPGFFEQRVPGKFASEPIGLGAQLFSGFLLALGTVVPGVSSSFLLMIAGTYMPLMDALANLRIAELLPVGCSALISAVIIAWIIGYLLREYYSWTYYGLLGVVIGSIIMVFPGLPQTLMEGFLGAVLLIIGAITTWILSQRKV